MHINKTRKYKVARRAKNAIICVKQKNYVRKYIRKTAKKIRKITNKIQQTLGHLPKKYKTLLWILNWKSQQNKKLT